MVGGFFSFKGKWRDVKGISFGIGGFFLFVAEFGDVMRVYSLC